MSIQACAQVYRLDLDPILKWLLMCLADNADPFGGNIFPTISFLSQKSSIPERTLQRHLKTLIEKGYLEVVRCARRPTATQPGRGTEYKLGFMSGSFTVSPKPNYQNCPAKLREEVIEAFAQTCTYCLKKGDDRLGPDGRSWHIDRILPGSRGGGYSPDNVTLSCGSCNSRKGAKLAPVENVDLGAKRKELGAKEIDTGAIAVAHDPSLDPSENRQGSARARGYKQLPKTPEPKFLYPPPDFEITDVLYLWLAEMCFAFSEDDLRTATQTWRESRESKPNHLARTLGMWEADWKKFIRAYWQIRQRDKERVNGNRSHEQPYTGPVKSVPNPVKDNCTRCRGQGTIIHKINGYEYAEVCTHQGNGVAAA